MATVEGTVERVVFTNEETHFSVLRVLAGDGTGLRAQVTAVGVFPAVHPGMILVMEGGWESDSRFGRQFRATGHHIKPPFTPEGIERYLASGMIKGIGKVTAARLVAAFGAATLEVIDKAPERLREVEGIGARRARDIRDGWENHKGIRDIMVFLASHGVSPGLAVRIHKRYGRDAVSVVQADPYRLADEVFGVGFKTADSIAQQVGIARDDPRRAEAGLAHVVGLAAGEGHLYVERSQLFTMASEALDIDVELLEERLPHLERADRVVTESLPEGGVAVYSAPLHAAEVSLAESACALSAIRARQPDRDAGRLVEEVESELGLVMAREQRAAVMAALQEKLVVITGGPGTGKTTIVRAIHRAHVQLGRRIALAAPTGRASRRLGEATGAAAKTIHRLLEFSPRSQVFERNAENPLHADLVVIDEASMLDVPLADSLLQAVPPDAQLVLVGDVDQLPPVGPWNFLHDVIESGSARVVRLTEIFRQGQESLIVLNAHRIHAGEWPESGQPGSGADFFFIPRETPEAIADPLEQVVLKRVAPAFGLDPRRDVQILTPMRRGELGAQRLNERFQASLNPGGSEVSRAGRTLRSGDKVMQIRNNYDKEVFNGDVGRVMRVDVDASEVHVQFDERMLLYEPSELDELVLAYAITVHKAQGSEYPAVILPLHGQHFMMLRRNLLYTGVTRGRQLVVIVGSERALRMALQRDDSANRASRLKERLIRGSHG